MLTAILNNGGRICLGDSWEKEKLMKIRENDSFSCPHCHEKVILKLGEKRIFHFSHMRDSTCKFEHEGESQYHLNGKIQLYRWLKNQNLNPMLEFFDTKMRQRADVMFIIGNKRHAIELQCTSISESLFRKRTFSYISNGYHPIWLLGAKQLTKKTNFKTSLSDFHYLFLQKTSSNHWMIPFYCSQTRKFIFHRSIQPVSIRNTLSDQKIVNIDKMSISQLLSPSFGQGIRPDFWVHELNHWKNRFIRYPGSYQNHFLKTLYQNNLNLLLLPPFLGLPVPNSPCIATPPLIWQTYLFIDVFLKKEKCTPIRFQEIVSAFIRRKNQNHIQLRQLPLIEDDHPSIAVHQYLQHLVNINLLRRLDDQTYIMEYHNPLPKTVDEQKKMEAIFYQKYGIIIFQT